jgi:hypothetical protein
MVRSDATDASSIPLSWDDLVLARIAEREAANSAALSAVNYGWCPWNTSRQLRIVSPEPINL